MKKDFLEKNYYHFIKIETFYQMFFFNVNYEGGEFMNSFCGYLSVVYDNRNEHNGMEIKRLPHLKVKNQNTKT